LVDVERWLMAESRSIFRHIMVPTDGSQSSVVAGRLAIRLAVAHQARITFAYVVDDAVVNDLAGVSGRMGQQVQRELELTGQRYLDYLSRLAVNAGLETRSEIRCGVPYSEIESLAREEGVDLIVIGQVGRRGPRRVLIGSVAERVVEYAPCPVLVVK
jgi:nucleotide-binding universal stress UspA family protein